MHCGRIWFLVSRASGKSRPKYSFCAFFHSCSIRAFDLCNTGTKVKVNLWRGTGLWWTPSGQYHANLSNLTEPNHSLHSCSIRFFIRAETLLCWKNIDRVILDRANQSEYFIVRPVATQQFFTVSAPGRYATMKVALE